MVVKNFKGAYTAFKYESMSLFFFFKFFLFLISSILSHLIPFLSVFLIPCILFSLSFFFPSRMFQSFRD
jgi:hypothetical protein